LVILANPEAIKPLIITVADLIIPNLANAVVGAEAGAEAVIKAVIEALIEAVPEAEAGAEAMIKDVVEAGIETEDLDPRTVTHDIQTLEFDASFARNVAILLENALPLKSCESSANHGRMRPPQPPSLQEWLATPI